MQCSGTEDMDAGRMAMAEEKVWLAAGEYQSLVPSEETRAPGSVDVDFPVSHQFGQCAEVTCADSYI